MSDVITALARDWTALRDSPAARLALRRWQRHEPVLGAYSSLAVLEAAMHDRATTAGMVDAVFTALLRVHRDDPLAGRVVLGLLVPALLRHRGSGADADDHRAQLVAELWHVICRYPIDRRPFAVPARLTRDARKRASRAATPAAPAPSIDAGATGGADRAVARIDDRVALTATARRAAVSDRDLALIAATRLGGWRIADLADSGVDADRLRQRRHRAEARLRRVLAS